MLSISGTTLVILSEAVLDGAFPLLYQAGVYLFLELYADGWVQVGLMGAVLALAGPQPKAGEGDDRTAARRIALAALVLVAPAALRMLIPRGLEGPLVWLSIAAGALFGLAQLYFLAIAWRLPPPAAAGPWWRLAALSLALKAILEFMPVLPAWSALALDRNPVIAYLHLKLLLLASSGSAGRPGRGARGRLAVGVPAVCGRLGGHGRRLAAHGLLAGAIPGVSWPLYAVAFAAAFPAAAGGIWAAQPWR